MLELEGRVLQRLVMWLQKPNTQETFQFEDGIDRVVADDAADHVREIHRVKTILNPLLTFLANKNSW